MENKAKNLDGAVSYEPSKSTISYFGVNTWYFLISCLGGFTIGFFRHKDFPNSESKELATHAAVVLSSLYYLLPTEVALLNGFGTRRMIKQDKDFREELRGSRLKERYYLAPIPLGAIGGALSLAGLLIGESIGGISARCLDYLL